MNKKYIKTSFSNKFEKVNEEFLKCTVSVMSADGQIANGTRFSVEAINKALSTLNYCPLIGYFNGEDFTDHGIELVINNEGFNEIIKTIPFGVVIKDSFRYVDMPKNNGESEKYLVCDVYMWTRYTDATKKVMDNKCNQSMEITVINGNWSEDCYDVTEFSFSGLCVLGESVTPAFNLAKIRTSSEFSKDEMKVQYNNMTSALDKFLNFDEGGNVVEKLEKMENETDEEFEKRKKCEEESLCPKCKETLDNEGECPNCDGENEDSDDEDMAKKKRRCSKCDLELSDEEEFVEGEDILCVKCKPNKKMELDEEEYSQLVSYKEKYSQLESEINEIKAQFSDLQSDKLSLETEVLELREYKTNIEKSEYESKVDEIIEKYSELKSVEGYSELIKNKYAMELDKLEVILKVFAFDNSITIGKKQPKKNFSKENNKIPVLKTNIDTPSNSAWNIIDKYIKK